MKEKVPNTIIDANANKRLIEPRLLAELQLLEFEQQ